MINITLQKMNFILLPSLEHISLASTAVALWKEYSHTSYDYRLDGQQLWNSVESEVTGIVATLPLPIPLRKKILIFSKVLHWEITTWVAVDLLYVPEEYTSMCVSHIQWTNIGTIEKKKTVESIVKNESLPITTRYELACMSCLVDDIHKLYEHIPDKNAYKDIANLEINGSYHNNGLIVLWTNYLRNGFSDNITFSITADGNKAVLEYFCKEKEPEILNDGEMCLIISGASNEMNSRRCHSEIIIFLLQRMDVEELKHIMTMDAEIVLRRERDLNETDKSIFSHILWCMVHWPWNSCFSESDHCTCRGYCDESNFSVILYSILTLPVDEPLGRNTQVFLHRQFWKYISDPCRKAVMNTKEFKSTLLNLCTREDHMNIELILEYFPDLKKGEFFREYWQIIYKRMLNAKNFDLLELFIREFIPSKREMIWFKADIIKEYKGRLQEPDTLKTIQLIDEYISGAKQSKSKTFLEQ